MIDIDNFKIILEKLNFQANGNIFFKEFPEIDAYLKVDFKAQKLIYPIDKGFKIGGDFTTSFKQNENFVVFECVHRLFAKGYQPQHIELEPTWTIGHTSSGGRADIMIKNNNGKSLLIIECKVAGQEFKKEWNRTLVNGGQIFSYAKQAGSTEFIALYTSDFEDDELKHTYYLITLKDNQQLLADLANKKPLSYEKAKLLDKEDIYLAWTETYQQDYATKGIFEADMQAYHIGKTKYSIKDLKAISNKDIQDKYNKFAEILRQHNVSGRENAFDKLVNLFLCKIVDETNNQQQLKFYWKGIAYDSYFDLQDRLQKLYQVGMKRFLGEEVTYIDNKAIDDAFVFFKNDPDATRDTIKDYFRQLKFFTNNDFAFIDVHNEKLFYQNATVLLKIVKMLQDIRLKTSEQNQFLGDLFEGFLDQGIKQSEGQYFTPMPIVKFIVKSLPIKQIIESSEEVPKVIDYACGAGHFLNEYARQIEPIVENIVDAKLTNYHENILGIEKEYRLSKVAKVSAFIYGQDSIDIVYADALATKPNIKEQDYSVLIANPPYSVKGFLETLEPSDRQKYELLDCVSEKSFAYNNSIETFFIERAKQLLKSEGVAGIILPISILTKGNDKSTSKTTNIYVATRELLLKFFDIIAIVELPKSTFGRTNTNTVVLFLRRKKIAFEAKHFRNRVNEWFNNRFDKEKIFEDKFFIRNYCLHIGIAPTDYQTLLEDAPNETLLKHDIFKAYKKAFDAWSATKNRKKQRSFKALSKTEQKAELHQRFIKYLKTVEKDKLYYFILASRNPQKVVVVKSPTKTSNIQSFLGYKWSAAKGNEGIKYVGHTEIVTDKNEENDGNVSIEENDKRVLENMLNLNNIVTPLYDPSDDTNELKINYLISQNFEGKEISIPQTLQKWTSLFNLEEMIDFTKTDFDKTINLVPNKKITFNSKWELVRIGDMIIENVKSKIKVRDAKDIQKGKYPFFTSGIKVLNFNKYLVENDNIFLSTGGNAIIKYYSGKAAYSTDTYCITTDKTKLLPYYFYLLMSSIIEEINNYYFEGLGLKHLQKPKLKSSKIPLPPLNVQQKIVDECLLIDAEQTAAEKMILEQQQEIERLLNDMSQKNYPQKKLDNIAIINPSKAEIKALPLDTMISFVEMSSVSEQGYIAHKEDRLLKDVKKGGYRYFKENDIIVAKITPCMENGKCAIATNLSNGIGLGSTEFHVFRIDENISSNKYVFAFLNRAIVRTAAEKNMTGSSGHKRVPASFYENLFVPMPEDKKIQEQLVKAIETCQQKIKQAQTLIQAVGNRKETVLKKYL